MTKNYSPVPRHRGSASTWADQRVLLVEAVAIAATNYRHLMASYLAGQAELIDEGVSIDGLVTKSWDQFEAVAAAEQRLFAAVDALDDMGGLSIVPRRE